MRNKLSYIAIAVALLALVAFLLRPVDVGGRQVIQKEVVQP